MDTSFAAEDSDLPKSAPKEESIPEVSSISSLSEFEVGDDDDDEGEDTRHTVFKTIMIHTAKCDVCNLHNKSTLRRCSDCGWQICTPCWEARGGNGAHGVSHKFTGPVFIPEKRRPVKRSRADIGNESDESGGAKKAVKAKGYANAKLKNAAKLRGGHAGNDNRRRVASRAAMPARGRHNARGANRDTAYGIPVKGKMPIPDLPPKVSETVIRDKGNVIVLDDGETENLESTQNTHQVASTPVEQSAPEPSPNDPSNPMYWLCKASRYAWQDFMAAENNTPQVSHNQVEVNQRAMNRARMGAGKRAARPFGAGEVPVSQSPYFVHEGNRVATATSQLAATTATGVTGTVRQHPVFVCPYTGTPANMSSNLTRRLMDSNIIQQEATAAREQVQLLPTWLRAQQLYARRRVSTENVAPPQFGMNGEQSAARGWDAGNDLGGAPHGRPWDL